MSGFQTLVKQTQAPAVEGDFASANNRSSVLAGDSNLVAGAAGVTVGNFAWTSSAGVVLNTYQSGGDFGYVHREQQALITTWLGQTSMVIPAGLAMGLQKTGDYWDKFVAGAAIGQKVYAYYADGTAYAAATATPPTMTGTVSTATSTTLTVTTAPASPIALGMPVSGTGIAAGTYVSAFGTGTGGLGTYILSAATTATASGVTATFTTAFETPWTVRSTAAANELAKISTLG